MTWKCALMQHSVRRRQGRHQVQSAHASRRPSCSASRAASRTRSARTSAPSTTSPRPTSAPTPDMAWTMDTYMNTVGAVNKQSVKGVVTGKPVARGGTLGRDKATGQGVVHCITEWAREKAFELEGSTMTVQGFGNVGSHSPACSRRKLGVSTVAVGDHTGLHLQSGRLQPAQAPGLGRGHGSIARLPRTASAITREEFFGTKADIFAPRALENQIGERRGRGARLKVVVEGANGPCNPDGEKHSARPRHRHPPRRPRQLRRRHRQLLRVGPEQALGELDQEEVDAQAREGDDARVPRGRRLRPPAQGATVASRRTPSRSAGSRRSTKSARFSRRPTDRGGAATVAEKPPGRHSARGRFWFRTAPRRW